MCGGNNGVLSLEDWNTLIAHCHSELGPPPNDETRRHLILHDSRLIALAVWYQKGYHGLLRHREGNRSTTAVLSARDPQYPVTSRQTLEELEWHLQVLEDAHIEAWAVIRDHLVPFATIAYESLHKEVGDREAMIDELALWVWKCKGQEQRIESRQRA